MDAQAVVTSVLDELARVLDAQQAALLDGRVDDLSGYAAAVNSTLNRCLSTPQHFRLPGTRARLQKLLARARANGDMLTQRQLDIQRSLDALGSTTPLLKDVQTQRVYAAAGGYGTPALRGKAFATA